MKEIPLTQGKVALVDDADYEWLMQFNWYATQPWSVWYAARKPRSGIVYMHRVLCGGIKTDHRDGDGLNNQRYNLRVATTTQNNGNQGLIQRNHSGFKGVSWDKQKNKWYACIVKHNKTVNLGRFSDPRDAATAYDSAAIDYFGEFAKTNTMMGLL